MQAFLFTVIANKSKKGIPENRDFAKGITLIQKSMFVLRHKTTNYGKEKESSEEEDKQDRTERRKKAQR
ncbi:MAG: hypothetical protein U0V74_08280 [Chitinophagales bacterium]